MANDPKLYREMSEPHASQDALSEATKLFYEGVRELRVKHKFANVLIVIESAYMSDDEEVNAIAILTGGDRTYALRMAAYSYGVLKQEDDEWIGKCLHRTRR